MEMWASCDVALPSVDDECALFGDPDGAAVLDRLAKVGASRGALKRGPEGPLSLATRTPLDTVPQVTNVVDTTAAGDSFNAGFLAALAQGQSDEKAMAAGHSLACKVICAPGAIIPWPPADGA